METDPPLPERQAVALALIEHDRGKVRSFDRALATFGDGFDWIDPTPDLLRFVEHMYKLPAGYLTGEDDNEIRDIALDRASREKVINGTPIPESFFEDTTCQSSSEPSEAEDSPTVVRTMRKLVRRSIWVYLTRPLLSLLMTIGWTANTLLKTDDWVLWLCSAMFAIMTLILFRIDLRRVRHGLELLRLPQGQFQSVMEGRLREEVGANLQDLMTRTTFAPAWFHDTLCRRRPISAADFAAFSTPELGDTRIAYAAVDRQLRQPRA